MSEPGSTNPIVFNNCISVKDAAEYSGYSQQYLRRLLRLGKPSGLKLGQVWLIKMVSLERFLEQVEISKDYRFGPK